MVAKTRKATKAKKEEKVYICNAMGCNDELNIGAVVMHSFYGLMRCAPWDDGAIHFDCSRKPLEKLTFMVLDTATAYPRPTSISVLT